jgi:hypothetical protein
VLEGASMAPRRVHCLSSKISRLCKCDAQAARAAAGPRANHTRLLPPLESGRRCC